MNTKLDPACRTETGGRYRSLTPQEVEVMCAKHVLWLNDDPSGERVDFSNCLLKELNLSRRNLNGAVFTGARFVNTALHHSELCFAECSGAAFVHCDAWDIVAEEADFKDAEFVACGLERGIFTHSNFSRAKFRDCSISCSSMQNCCIDGTEFGDMPLISVNIDGWNFNEQAWLSEANGIVLSMQ